MTGVIAYLWTYVIEWREQNKNVPNLALSLYINFELFLSTEYSVLDG